MEIEIQEKCNSAPKKVVGTQVPASMYERLQKDAEIEFMSISDLLRKIIYLYYKDKDDVNNEMKGI